MTTSDTFHQAGEPGDPALGMGLSPQSDALPSNLPHGRAHVISSAEHDAKWQQLLNGNDCPPLLGLAPLSDEGRESIRAAVEVDLAIHRFDRLGGIFALLRSRPAMMAVWLSRLAGDAYNEGNFWGNFADAMKVAEVAINRRESFANLFRSACKRTMSAFVHPQLTSHRYLGEFLFQAGLPLCHCEQFVRVLRQIADVYGLPEPDDIDAIDDFRHAMVPRFLSPVLKKALEAESGAYLLATALRVIRDNAFENINPQLGERLAASFQSGAGRAAQFEAIKWPFLRLGPDLTSFEIVGPRQPRNLIGAQGIRWVVNGTQHFTGADEEAVISVSDASEAVVELLGMRSNARVQREFALHPDEGDGRFFVFSGKTRRQVRVASSGDSYLECGDYLVVHPRPVTVTALDITRWNSRVNDADELVTSVVSVKPGTVISIEEGSQNVLARILPSTKPFIETRGSKVSDFLGAAIHYQWTDLPRIWIASDDADADWAIEVVTNQSAKRFALAKTGSDGSESMVARDFAGWNPSSLKPGLHEIELRVLRNGRIAQRDSYFYWSGLNAVSDEFHCERLPENLDFKKSWGFVSSGNNLKHSTDSLAEHRLVFTLGDGSASFVWPEPGVFLFSYERRPGVRDELIPKTLGESFAAEHSSNRWLRVSIWPPQDAEIFANGKKIFSLRKSDSITAADISLANLAALADSGSVEFYSAGVTRTLAKFNRPLVASDVDITPIEDATRLRMTFTAPLGALKVTAHEILSGERLEYAPFDFEDLRKGFIIAGETMPPMDVTYESESSLSSELKLDILKNSLPTGIWLIECQLRRPAASDFQVVRDTLGGRIVMIIPHRAYQTDDDDYRALCIKAFFHNPANAIHARFPSSEGNGKAICDLFAEMRQLLADKYSHRVMERFKNFERLSTWLTEQADYLLHHHPGMIETCLVEVLAADSNPNSHRSILSWVPGIYGLRSSFFADLPATDALRGALRWCADLDADTYREGLLPALNIGGTFAILEPRPAPEILSFFSVPKALAGFDFGKWLRTLEAVAANPLELEYDQIEPLSSEHFSWAMGRFLERRKRTIDEYFWEAISQVWMRPSFHWMNLFSDAPPEVLVACAGASAVRRVWPEIDIENDAVASAAPRFAAFVALAARMAARKGKPFHEEMGVLCGPESIPALPKARSNLLIQAPELFGFYLMFWELIFHPTKP